MEEMQKQPENQLAQNLSAAITQEGGIDIRKVDNLSINLQLRKYKNPNGTPNFPALFEIPKENRIAAMATRDLGGTIQLIAAALTLAFEKMNLARPMTAFQVLDLAEEVVDSAAESDAVALEDLVLFLQKLVRGEYGPMYEGMDIPKFMERFGKYRDERYDEAVRIRDEKHLEYKSLGDTNRSSQVNPLADHLASFAGKIGALKDQLRDKNDEIKRLREDQQ
jgi:hypothetical protein